MAQGNASDKSHLFIKRARHFNLSFVVSITILFVVSLAAYPYFSMPVTSKLVLYMYLLISLTGAVAIGASFAIRKKMLPVSLSDPHWSYTAVRRYFWSYVMLSVPFGISFLFYIFAGNLSTLILGYLLSLCGLIIFRPREGDVE